MSVSVRVDLSVDDAKCVLEPLECTRDPSSLASARTAHPFFMVYYRFSQLAPRNVIHVNKDARLDHRSVYI